MRGPWLLVLVAVSASCGRLRFDDRSDASTPGDTVPRCRPPEPPAPPCTLYVGPGGSDMAAGTRAQPFATMAHGLTVGGPGIALCVLEGMYTEVLVSVWPSGSPGQPFVLMAELGAHVRITPPTVTGEVLGLGGVGAAAIHDVELRGLELDTGGVLIAEEAYRIRVVDLYIHDTIDQGASTQPGTHDNEMLRVRTERTVRHGIALRGADQHLIDCDVRGNTGNDYAIQVFDSTDRAEVRGCTITGNDFTGLLLSTGGDIVATNNLVFGNPGGILIAFSTERARVQHNTVVLPAGPGIFIGSDANNSTVLNNLASLRDDSVTTTFTTNLDPDNSMFVTPNVDFHLRPGAAPVGGATISDVCDDHDERPRDAEPDLGAFEL